MRASQERKTIFFDMGQELLSTSSKARSKSEFTRAALSAAKLLGRRPDDRLAAATADAATRGQRLFPPRMEKMMQMMTMADATDDDDE